MHSIWCFIGPHTDKQTTLLAASVVIGCIYAEHSMQPDNLQPVAEVAIEKSTHTSPYVSANGKYTSNAYSAHENIFFCCPQLSYRCSCSMHCQHLLALPVYANPYIKDSANNDAHFACFTCHLHSSHEESDMSYFGQSESYRGSSWTWSWCINDIRLWNKVNKAISLYYVSPDNEFYAIVSFPKVFHSFTNMLLN